MIIGVNCGHTVSGTVGSGAVGCLNESDQTRNVGYAMMDILSKSGHTVIDCTNDYAATVSANLAEICSLANSQPLDLFVSIHFNSGGGRGSEVYTYGGKKLDYAVNVCDELHGLGFVNRGVKDGSNLYVIRHTNAMAMLVEVCFVDTQSDCELYNKVTPVRVAEAICRGITGEISGGELTVSQYEELNERLKKLEHPMIYNYIDDNMPKWAHEGVKWCVDNGIVQGTGNGLGLDDNKLWQCVTLYRLAKFMGK